MVLYSKKKNCNKHKLFSCIQVSSRSGGCYVRSLEYSWKNELLGTYLNQFYCPLTARCNAFVLFITSAAGLTTGWWQDLWTHRTLHFTSNLMVYFCQPIKGFQLVVAMKSQGFVGPSILMMSLGTLKKNCSKYVPGFWFFREKNSVGPKLIPNSDLR